MREMRHFTLAEKVKNLLATAGLGIAATEDPGYSTGARVEIDDAGSGEVAVYVARRVHPTLHRHFLAVDPACLPTDEQVALKWRGSRRPTPARGSGCSPWLAA
jgi:hypothetical protein